MKVDIKHFFESAGMDLMSDKIQKLIESTSKVDVEKTREVAKKIADTLNKYFNGHVDVNTKNDGDYAGAVEFQIRMVTDDRAQSEGENNMNVVTPKNVNKVIDPFYREFRQNGWYFSQPVGGKFTIYVPAE